MSSGSSRTPYYAVIFRSRRKDGDHGYSAMAEKMFTLAREQEGFLSVESVRDDTGLGLTISYWTDLQAISRWKQQLEHLEAQKLGRDQWYKDYRVQVCLVEYEYEFQAKTNK